MPRPRLRELGLTIGRFPAGPHNLVTDVGDVRVGHATVHSTDPHGRDACTGVTVILPHGGDIYREKVRAAVHTINGYGKPLGFEQVRELGTLESPIALTNTFNVGLVADALVQLLCEADPGLGLARGRGSLNVVVGETNDGWLNHLPSRAVRVEQVRAALEAAATREHMRRLSWGRWAPGRARSASDGKAGSGARAVWCPTPAVTLSDVSCSPTSGAGRGWWSTACPSGVPSRRRRAVAMMGGRS